MCNVGHVTGRHPFLLDDYFTEVLYVRCTVPSKTPWVLGIHGTKNGMHAWALAQRAICTSTQTYAREPQGHQNKGWALTWRWVLTQKTYLQIQLAPNHKLLGIFYSVHVCNTANFEQSLKYVITYSVGEFFTNAGISVFCKETFHGLHFHISHTL